MKGNRNDGMGLETAAAKLTDLWNDMFRTFGFGTRLRRWDESFRRIVSQMRKRARIEKKRS